MKSNTKKYGVDILILSLSALVAYGILGIFYMLLKIDMGALPLLVQTLIGALCQFGLMGFGVVIICVRNKESIASFGLKKGKTTVDHFAVSTCLFTWFPFSTVYK